MTRNVFLRVSALVLVFGLILMGCPTGGGGGGGDPTVTAVSISPSTSPSVEQGRTRLFTATVEGENSPSQSVTWSISGKTSSYTSIGQDGTLHVGGDEPAGSGSLKVKATSVADTGKSKEVTVTVTAKTYTVSSVDVTPASPSVERGGSQVFEVEVKGSGDIPQDVYLSVSGNQSQNTKINGKTLNVAANEPGTSDTLTVTVVPAADPGQSAVINVTLTGAVVDPPTVTSVSVSPDTVDVAKGGTRTFTATVTGTGDPAQTVSWSVDGGTGTTINTDGELTVASTETKTTLTVTATSTVDSSKTGTATVTVITEITYSVDQVGGTAGTANSTGIEFTFSETVTGLVAADITLTSDTGTAVKGALNGSGTTWTLALSSVTTEGDVKVSITKSGIESAQKTVAVYKSGGSLPDDDITYNAEQVGGAAGTATSTAIKFTFSEAVTGLVAADITLTSDTGVAVKGTLNGSGTTWTLTLTSVTTAGNVKVSITKSGIESDEKTVAVYKALFNSGWNAISAATSTFGASIGINDIAFGNNTFVAVGDNGKMARSTDNGASWTVVVDSTFPSGYYGGKIYAIAFGNNTFIATGEDGKAAYSTDNGETWIQVTGIVSGNGIDGIAFGNGVFIVFSGFYDGSYMARSTDNGQTWSPVTSNTFSSPTNVEIQGIGYGNNVFIAVGSNNTILRSTDYGLNWSKVVDGSFGSTAVYSIAYGGGSTFVAGAGAYSKATNTGGKMAVSNDSGVTWTQIATIGASSFSSVFPNYAQMRMGYGNNTFVAWGSNLKMVTSTNGQDWTQVSGGLGYSDSSGDSIYGIAFGNGRFITVGSNGKMALWDPSL
jgi:hypothetical protein